MSCSKWNQVQAKGQCSAREAQGGTSQGSEPVANPSWGFRVGVEGGLEEGEVAFLNLLLQKEIGLGPEV